MPIYPRICAVAVVRPFVVQLTFRDGSVGVVDLGPKVLAWCGVFTALHDPAEFARVTVDQQAGTIVWPNGVDLDPDVLYEAAHGLSTLELADRG
jgi:hypothetical protein